MAKRKILLNDWIEKEGVPKIAALLKVQRGTVYHWLSGHCMPRVDQMTQIKKLTNGRVGYEQIIEQHSQTSGK